MKRLNERAQECILVGFDEKTIHGYICFKPSTKTYFVTNRILVISTGAGYGDDVVRSGIDGVDDVRLGADPYMNAPTEAIEKFMVLLNTRHIDDEDGLLYEVTRVIIEKRHGLIVAYRKMVLSDGTLYKRELGPYNVQEIFNLTKFEGVKVLGTSGVNLSGSNGLMVPARNNIIGSRLENTRGNHRQATNGYKKDGNLATFNSQS